MIRTGETINGYQILEKINIGSYCDSYIAEKGGKKYFFKAYSDPTEMSPEFKQFLENQKIMVPRLNSLGDSIETIVEQFVVDGLFYQVKKLLPGVNLSEWMDTHLDYESRLEVAKQLVGCVQLIHGQGIIHHDLKPEQVMVVSDAPVKIVLTDFDWSVPDGKAVKASIGTDGYRCPDDKISEQSDIFTLGIVLTILLTGANPYQHLFDGTFDKWSKWVERKQYKEPIDLNPEDVTPAVNDMIVKCLDPSPKNRPSLDTILSTLNGKSASRLTLVILKHGDKQMIIPNGTAANRRLFKICFPEILDDMGNQIYRYISHDENVLQVSSEDGGLSLSIPDGSANQFMINGTAIARTPVPVNEGDSLAIYSVRRSKVVAEFTLGLK